MGASVGAAARSAGTRVLWCSEGRGAATRDRAESAELEERTSLQTLCDESDFVVSVCPPAHERLAADVAATGFSGVFVDANAVAPDTVRALEVHFDVARVRFVDGGLIGPPAWREGTTRLHLSGEGAAEVAALFAGSSLEAHVVEGGVGAASALKMVFAAQTKGHSALLLAALAAAAAHGVEEALLAEWEKTQPALVGRVQGSAPMLAAKAWRFEGEMLEIAETLRAAGLPPGFHQAAAELYGRLAGFKDAEAPDLATVLAQLRDVGS
jgi:3-hydroxyisobutyrate dehydrogenase-like beta-hydroxyacid dehydrogenase